MSIANAIGTSRSRFRSQKKSFASMLIYQDVDVVELAPELGHSLATCWRYYARVLKEFKGIPPARQ